MKKKINCILLIDDDEPTNFMNELIIQQHNCAEKTIAIQNPLTALAYLTELHERNEEMPALIFLDINMPGMNGWEFLEAYRKIIPSEQHQVVIIMLTTSLNPDDRERADTIKEITAYTNKPLSYESLDAILKLHFPEI